MSLVSRRSLVALMAAISLGTGCTNEAPSAAAPVHPEILIVLPGAEDVKHTKDYDRSVSYRLPEPHPADATLKQIRSQLEGKGWKPVPEDLDAQPFPGMTNSHDRGWMNYIDIIRNDANVFLWSAATLL